MEEIPRPIFTNRLIAEKSPYLLQHAHNPVDWYPWGEEAFAAAVEQDKPIFLSIGYATCHFCHVMEQESFQNPEIARALNETFINIKVDREELPEIDSLYMEFAQAMMSGSAGWPLNLILTPELKPFFAATYLPSDARLGFLGLRQLIHRIHEIWVDPEERENVIIQAGKIVDIFASHVHIEGKELPTKKEIVEAAELLFKGADPIYGGTKGSPKFPIGYQACFLLRFARMNSDSRALFYVERTLDMMHRGGIYDHLGGGFARYSVDERWLVPHFEKMLYDNAILARAYLETYQLTRQGFYREVTEEILSYVLREMTGEEGGFYSAQDADSENEEGAFYVWSWEEIQHLLGHQAPIFSAYYGVTPGGNFEGKNVLNTPVNLQEFSAQNQIDPVQMASILRDSKKILLENRKKRVHPIKDDKILTSWNGLMIYALAEAGRVLSNEKYLDAAEKSARFIKDNLWKEGILYRRWREGEARYEGCLDDYAFLIHGLLSLFEADRGAEWLEFALNLTHVLNQEFKAPQGAYYLTNGRDPHLILRRCEFYDGAEPSGNAVQAENLLRLGAITGSQEFLPQVEDILRAAKEHIDAYPPGACYHLMALMRYLDTESPTFLISLNEQGEFKEEISKMFAGHYLPHKVTIWRREEDEELCDFVPWSRDKLPENNKTTLYLCNKKGCNPPLTELPKIWEIIEKL